MTCVAAITDGTKVTMGADSAGVFEHELELRADPKVFIKGQFIIGMAGSFRLGQLLRYGLSVPPRPCGQPLHEYMCTTFVDAARNCFRSGGFMTTEDGQERASGEVLIGTEGRLFTMYCNFQIGQELNSYSAVGTGAQVARGSLFTTANWSSPVARIEKALEAAERFCSGVRAPFTVLSL